MPAKNTTIPDDQRLLFDADGAAKALGIGIEELAALTRAGYIGSVKLAGVRYTRSALANFLADGACLERPLPAAAKLLALRAQAVGLRADLTKLRKRVDQLEAASLKQPARKQILASQRQRIKDRDQQRCRYCGRRRMSVYYHIDHVIPIGQKGSSNEDENLVLACRDCNMKKGNRTPQQAGMILLPVSSTGGEVAPPAPQF